MSVTAEMCERLYMDTEAVLAQLRSLPPALRPFHVPRLPLVGLRRLDLSMPDWHFVTATREGLVGQQTATGLTIGPNSFFVALPSRHALYRTVRVVNPETGDMIVATVLELGPWNIHDDGYVLDTTGATRPQSESGIDWFGRPTNGAGIDLSNGAWTALHMRENSPVLWQFADMPMPDHDPRVAWETGGSGRREVAH